MAESGGSGAHEAEFTAPVTHLHVSVLHHVRKRIARRQYVGRDSGHQCFDSSIESPEPLCGFRRRTTYIVSAANVARYTTATQINKTPVSNAALLGVQTDPFVGSSQIR